MESVVGDSPYSEPPLGLSAGIGALLFSGAKAGGPFTGGVGVPSVGTIGAVLVFSICRGPV